jgi:hypothetical protein
VYWTVYPSVCVAIFVSTIGDVPVELNKEIEDAVIVGVAFNTTSDALAPCDPPEAAKERLSKTYPYPPK